MRAVNYKNVANKYEKNPERFQDLTIDPDLFRLSLEKKDSSLNVLDVGCGTGIYLDYQIRCLSNNKINWYGVDKSESMLDISRSKKNQAKFFCSSAENLPFESESIDYLVCLFAFHHFPKKKTTLGEFIRVLKPQGICKIITISPEFLEQWYIYHYFPKASEIDLTRCWNVDDFQNHLENHGINPTISVEKIYQKISAKQLLDIALNRDISELILLKDADYQLGLQKLREDAQKSNKIQSIFSKLIVKFRR